MSARIDIPTLAIVEWTTAEELAARIARDIARWRALAKEAAIRAQ